MLTTNQDVILAISKTLNLLMVPALDRKQLSEAQFLELIDLRKDIQFLIKELEK